MLWLVSWELTNRQQPSASSSSPPQDSSILSYPQTPPRCVVIKMRYCRSSFCSLLKRWLFEMRVDQPPASSCSLTHRAKLSTLSSLLSLSTLSTCQHNINGWYKSWPTASILLLPHTRLEEPQLLSRSQSSNCTTSQEFWKSFAHPLDLLLFVMSPQASLSSQSSTCNIASELFWV